MMLLRLAVCSLIAVLVLAPCLGFAAGDVVLSHWTRHHRTAGAPNTGTTPGILPYLSALAALGPAGAVTVRNVIVVSSLALRPPFVPQRA